jgi:tetratricopeptide (TPR) repeat protein
LLGTESEAWLQLDIGIINLAGDHLLEAECAFEKCRALLAKYRGPEHSDVSRPVRGLALVALQRGNLEEAGEIARQAVALCEGEGAEYIGARAKQVLAQVLLEADRIDEASGILDSMGDMFGTTVGSRHIRVAERYAILAELHLRQGEFGPAAVIAERCEAMRRQILHEDHWAIREAQLLRLRAQIGSGETSNADRQLLEISSHVARLLGDDHPLMIAVAKVRLEYAHALGDASLAAVRAERLASLQTRRDARLEAIHTSE